MECHSLRSGQSRATHLLLPQPNIQSHKVSGRTKKTKKKHLRNTQIQNKEEDVINDSIEDVDNHSSYNLRPNDSLEEQSRTLDLVSINRVESLLTTVQCV